MHCCNHVIGMAALDLFCYYAMCSCSYIQMVVVTWLLFTVCVIFYTVFCFVLLKVYIIVHFYFYFVSFLSINHLFITTSKGQKVLLSSKIIWNYIPYILKLWINIIFNLLPLIVLRLFFYFLFWSLENLAACVCVCVWWKGSCSG